jgi:hypothetical protein
MEESCLFSIECNIKKCDQTLITFSVKILTLIVCFYND